jgi:hypothetical protein
LYLDNILIFKLYLDNILTSKLYLNNILTSKLYFKIYIKKCATQDLNLGAVEAEGCNHWAK